MPQIASWKGKVFETSSKMIAPVEDLSTGLTLEANTNTDNEGQSPTYEKKFQLQNFSFSAVYSTDVGADPIKEQEEWYQLVGERAPLFLGGKQYGPPEIQLKSVTLSDIMLDDFGRMRKAKFAFSFTEYAPEKSAEKKNESSAPAVSSSSSATPKASGASSTDKAKWKERMEADG